MVGGGVVAKGVVAAVAAVVGVGVVGAGVVEGVVSGRIVLVACCLALTTRTVTTIATVTTTRKHSTDTISHIMPFICYRFFKKVSFVVPITKNRDQEEIKSSRDLRVQIEFALGNEK